LVRGLSAPAAVFNRARRGRNRRELSAGATGIPLVLNTSFNENELVVNTPAPALGCFLRTKMDLLVMGDVMIRRE
jgi:carbamoyltransferase